MAHAAARTEGGYCVPDAPFDFSAKACGSRIGVSEGGYWAVNPIEFLAIDARLTFGAHDPLWAVQYNDTDSNPRVNTFADTHCLEGNDGPVYFKTLDPLDTAKRVLVMRVSVLDAPGTPSGQDDNEMKRTEHTIGRYIRSGDRVLAGFSMLTPSEYSFKLMREGDRAVVFQYHDANLGSGLGPTISLRYEGGEVPRRSVWVNGCATLPNRDNWRKLYEDDANDPRWKDDVWQTWIFQQRLHYDPEAGPWTEVYLDGELIASEYDATNCFNDSEMVNGASHYPKFGIYYYNQSAQSQNEGASFALMLKLYRLYVNRPSITPAQLQQLLASY